MQISRPQPAPPPGEDAEPSSTDRTSEAGPSQSSGHKLVPDGQKLHVSGELLILAVGNGRQAGGGMRLCPYAGQSQHHRAVCNASLLDISCAATAAAELLIWSRCKSRQCRRYYRGIDMSTCMPDAHSQFCASQRCDQHHGSHACIQSTACVPCFAMGYHLYPAFCCHTLP